MEGCNENFPGVITETHLPNSTSSLYVVSKHRSGFVAAGKGWNINLHREMTTCIRPEYQVRHVS